MMSQTMMSRLLEEAMHREDMALRSGVACFPPQIGHPKEVLSSTPGAMFHQPDPQELLRRSYEEALIQQRAGQMVLAPFHPTDGANAYTMRLVIDPRIVPQQRTELEGVVQDPRYPAYPCPSSLPPLDAMASQLLRRSSLNRATQAAPLLTSVASSSLQQLPPAIAARDHGKLKRFLERTPDAPSSALPLSDLPPPKRLRTEAKRPSFPMKLMEALILSERELMASGGNQVFAWVEDGCSFVIFGEDDFLQKVLQRHGLCDRYTKYDSFVRKLNRWGFSRLRYGSRQCFQHKLFQKGRLDLCKTIKGGGKIKADKKTPASATEEQQHDIVKVASLISDDEDPSDNAAQDKSNANVRKGKKGIIDRAEGSPSVVS